MSWESDPASLTDQLCLCSFPSVLRPKVPLHRGFPELVAVHQAEQDAEEKSRGNLAAAIHVRYKFHHDSRLEPLLTLSLAFLQL